MTELTRRTVKINGIDTVVLEAGQGPALVYLHGAGTVTRFDFVPQWARRYRVIAPFHPGFGESADDLEITDVHDYVLHYLELFETLGLERVYLVGHSLGGFIAAKFAIEHRRLVEKLALVCPIGIPMPSEYATVDFLKTPPEELPALLAADPQTVIKHLPSGPPSAAFIGERTKETATAGRLLERGAFDRKLPRYLHRLTMPTLVVWGNRDRLTPVQQHERWMKLLPNASLRRFDAAGHLVLDEAPEAVEAIAEFFS